MARPRRGTLKRRRTKQGTSYGVSFSLRGEEFYEHFGGEWEGSDEQRVEEQSCATRTSAAFWPGKSPP